MDSEAKNLIENNAVGIATINSNGSPHQAGVPYLKVVSDDQILITDNFLGRTAENIKQNSKVALITWNKDWEKECVGYSVEGNAEYFSEGN